MNDEKIFWQELAILWDGNDFGHAHDWLGERWNKLIQTRPLGHDDPDARFLQGLAFAALAFYFTQDRNQEGALLLLDDAHRVLSDFQPEWCGLNVAPLLVSLETLRPLIVGIPNEAPCPMRPFSCNPLSFSWETL